MGQGHVHNAAGANKKRPVIVFGLTSFYLLARGGRRVYVAQPGASRRRRAHAHGRRGTRPRPTRDPFCRDHGWALISGVDAMSAHVVIADDSLHDEILPTVHEQITANFKIAHVTVQIENVGWRDCEAHP